MKFEKSTVGLILLSVGLILSVIGMISYTGIADIGVPSAVMYVGYAVTLAGLAVIFMDLKSNEELIEDYLDNRDIEGLLSQQPDDDYIIDLSGTEEKHDAFFVFGTGLDDDEPQITDLTKR